MRRPIEGLILGRSLRASEPVGFNHPKRPSSAGKLITYTGDGHLMTIAPTGTGKTSGPVITNALTHPGQLIIIDIKGEVYRATAGQSSSETGAPARSRSAGRIREQPLPQSHRPAALGGTETSAIARSLASDLVERTSREREPFWGDWAETLIAAGIAYAMEDASPENRNLAHVFDIYHHDDANYKIAEMLDAKQIKTKSAYAAIAAYLNIRADATMGGIMSTTQQHLRLFGSELSNRLTSTTTIDLAALVAGEPMSLYIIVPPHRLRAYRPLLRGCLTGLIMAFTRRKKMPKYRTLMLCDEIGNLGYLDAFVTAASRVERHLVNLLAEPIAA